MNELDEQMIASLESEHVEKLTLLEINFLEDLADQVNITHPQRKRLQEIFDRVAKPPL